MSESIRLARAVLIEAFERDPDFLRVYVANVACQLLDGQGEGPPLDMRDPEVRNEYATRIMRMMFSHDQVAECEPPELMIDKTEGRVPPFLQAKVVHINRIWQNDFDKYSAPTIEEATRLRAKDIGEALKGVEEAAFDPEPMADDEVIEVILESADELPDWLKGERRAQPFQKGEQFGLRATAKVFAEYETGCICTKEW